MKKLLTTFLAISLLTACATQPAVVDETTSPMETSVINTSITEGTTPKNSNENAEKNSIDSIKVVDEYDCPVLRKDFVESLSEWKQKNDIVLDKYLFCTINDYILISECSGEILGNTQTPYIIVDYGDGIAEIDAKEILYSSRPLFYIKDDVLYIYDCGLGAGIEHTYFVEFSLRSSTKINEYLEAYSLGSTELYKSINTYSDIKNAEQLESYICKISNQWYTGQSKSWEQPQQSTSEITISEKVEIGSLNEDKMKSKINEFFNGNILFWNYDDYNNDNIFEAVALIGEENFDVMNGTLVSINSQNSVTVIKENIACEDIFAFSVCDNTKYLCLSYHTTQDRSLIYGLKNNLFCEAVISNVGQNFTVLDSCNDFTLIQSTSDNMTVGTALTGSHTHKPYYFFYDNGFKEYGGTEITVNELKEYEGSEEILNIIEDKNGNILSVIKRSNGIININYCVENVEQNIIWNYYLTVQLQDDNTLQYQDEGDGVYLSALVPEIAVY